MRLHNQDLRDFHQKNWWDEKVYWWKITWNGLVIGMISLVLIIIYLAIDWDWVFGLRP